MIEYSDNKLIVENPTCNCDYHILPATNIYIGSDIIKKSVEYIKKHIQGVNCLLVTDQNIFSLFGKQVIAVLSDGFNVSVCIPPSESDLKPDNSALGYIMMEYKPDTDFMIALGSGTVNDLVRYAASLVKIPFVSIGTAPSMDGYVSVISPLLKGNLKINVPANYPLIGIYDIDILATAPREMFFAGFGDIIGKYIARADWILSSFITGEHVCPYCIELSDEAINLVESNIDEISANTRQGAKVLLEALLLTGLAMLINTNSRPAASNEHNIGHFWEMRKLAENKPHPSHGEAVGISTLYCLAFYEKILSLDPGSINSSNFSDDSFDPETRESLLLKAYGHAVGRSIIDDNPDEPISNEERIKRVGNFKNKFNDIKATLSFLPSYNEVREIYKKLDGPLNARQIGIESCLLKDGLLYAKDYRDRYNVFKTAAELGILNETVESILALF